MKEARRAPFAAWPALVLAAALGCWLFALARAIAHALPDLRAQETVAVLAFALAAGKVGFALRRGAAGSAARASTIAAFGFPVATAAWSWLVPSARGPALTAACAVLLGLPLAAASLASAIDRSASPRRVAPIAAWLAAVGVGASGALLALPALGAEGALAAACVLASLAALGEAHTTALRVAAAIALLGALAANIWPGRLFAVTEQTAVPSELRQLRARAAALGLTLAPRFDRWEASGRVQSFELLARDGATGFGALLRDSGLVAPLVRGGRGPHAELVAALCEHSLQGVPFSRPRARVLLAGIGGGLELQCAAHHRATHIDVAEPSAAQDDAVRAFVGASLDAGLTRVRRIRASARAWRKRSSERYDLVVLASGGTKHTLPAGVLPVPQTLRETDRGLSELLSRLDEDGMLWVTTRSEPAALRMAAMARKALQGRGVAAPALHLAVHRDGDSYGMAVARAALPLNQVLELHARAKQRTPAVESPALKELFDVPLSAPELIFTPGAAFTNRFGVLLARPGDQPPRGLQRVYAFDIAPATDDRPLFHERTRRDRPDTWSRASAFRSLPQLTAIALACALGLIVLLTVRLRPPSALRSALAIGALGAGQTLFFAFWLHALALWTERAEHTFVLMALALPALALMRLPWRMARGALPWALATHALSAAAAVPVAPLLVLLFGHSAVAVATVLLFALAAALSWYGPRADPEPTSAADHDDAHADATGAP